MTQPSPRFSHHAQRLLQVIQRQSWLLFGMIVLAALADYSLSHLNFIISKNVLAGGVLAWLTHYLFAKLSLRTSGARFRRQIVNNFYLAQAVKWLITMLGFALIFSCLHPLAPIWVFIGYTSMLLGQMILLYFYNKNPKSNEI